MKKKVIGLVALIILCFSFEVLGDTGYLKIDEYHAISNYSKTKEGYTYDLFCIESQKMQPSNEVTAKCSFCDNDISELTKYISDYTSSNSSASQGIIIGWIYSILFLIIVFVFIVWVINI